MAYWKSAVCLTWLSLGLASGLLAQPAQEEIPNWTVPGPAAVQEMESAAVPAATAVLTPPTSFVGLTPCRIVDTRGHGFGGAYGPPALTAGVPRDFTLTGRCGIPANAQAVSLNIAVILPSGSGYLATFPKGGTVPLVSTINFSPGQVIANAAIVPLGANGAITVYTGGSGAGLLIDTNGYFVGPPNAASFKVIETSNIQCGQALARLDTFTGNTSGFSGVGLSQTYFAKDGSWFYQAVSGDCSPMTNAPRAYALVPVDSQGVIVRGYWTLQALP